MTRWSRSLGVLGLLLLARAGALAPAWFDPAETPGIITPRMPGNAMAPSLAESGSACHLS